MTLSERGSCLVRVGIWSQSWCQDVCWGIYVKARVVWRGTIRSWFWGRDICWRVGLKARVVWCGSIRSHSRCRDICSRVCLRAKIVWRGSEIIIIWIALYKKYVVIGLKPIGLGEIVIRIPEMILVPVADSSGGLRSALEKKKKLTQAQPS